MQLSALFSEGMVLQRGAQNLLWGRSRNEAVIRGCFANMQFKALAGKDGYFELILPEAPAGGPYELRVSDGEEICIRNILVGDVFLLGGQSNMELPLSRTLDLFREELKFAGDPDIRLFEVPKEYEFSGDREEILNGKWIQAAGKDLLAFSAVGFFTAWEVKAASGVPVGLLQTAVGGTPITAWCSGKTLCGSEFFHDKGQYAAVIKQCQDASYIKSITDSENRMEQEWKREAASGFCDAGAVHSGKLTIPGLFRGTNLAAFHGSLRLQKKIYLEHIKENITARLSLGAIVDADRVYLNGYLIGETGYQYPPRTYMIPCGILRTGENIISIEMLVFRECGGFVPGKRYAIMFGEDMEESIDLCGEWEYSIGREMPVLPDKTNFQYMPSGLYHGMIAPIRKWSVCSILFYQGESDTGHPGGYHIKMEAMIHDWRSIREENTPFIYVQLAGFLEGAEKKAAGVNWALLREEQTKVLRLPYTAMAVAYDVGEYNDLHPQDKKTVGRRIALAVRRLVYKEDIEYSGPVFKNYKVEEKGFRLFFSHMGRGLTLVAKKHGETGSEPAGFEYYTKDGNLLPARAEVCSEFVRVFADTPEDIRRIQYAWSDCPEDAGLYNQEGLPAVPFRIEIMKLF